MFWLTPSHSVMTSFASCAAFPTVLANPPLCLPLPSSAAQVVVDAFDPGILVTDVASLALDFGSMPESDLLKVDLPLKLTIQPAAAAAAVAAHAAAAAAAAAAVVGTAAAAADGGAAAAAAAAAASMVGAAAPPGMVAIHGLACWFGE